jgi:hypothetical protein
MRLPQLTAALLPERLDDASGRRRLLTEFGIEVGGGWARSLAVPGHRPDGPRRHRALRRHPPRRRPRVAQGLTAAHTTGTTATRTRRTIMTPSSSGLARGGRVGIHGGAIEEGLATRVSRTAPATLIQ